MHAAGEDACGPRMNETLLHERVGDVAVITLNRPEKLNALSGALFSELRQTLLQLAGDDNLRALILTGSGRAFCAGTDISELVQLNESDALAICKRGQDLCSQVEQFPVPVIAAVNGIAAGGGFELLLGCHIRVASTSATFSLPEIKLGLMPPYGGTQRLAREIGLARAHEMILTGDWVTAETAYAMGLVNRVVAPEEVVNEAWTIARQIENLSSSAIRACLKAVLGGLDLPLQEGLALERKIFVSLFPSEDVREGTRAFMEKREPNFRRVTNNGT